MIYANKRTLLEAISNPEFKVLDVGFYGQGVHTGHDNWPHRFIRAKDLYGVDIEFDRAQFPDTTKYTRQSAESFVVPEKFDLIIALDLIEHLSNPGLFLTACAKHLKTNGKIVISTPNTFNLFNVVEKITKYDPTVNHDHTAYFNGKTLRTLARKNGLRVEHIDMIYSLENHFTESWKKKILNVVYRFSSFFTDKFMETIVVTFVKE